MASSPMHMDNQAPASRPKAGKPPITASPAFPWIVALWFAALLGVGSLIVPVALMESATTASGLASVFPMAAPPLGFTAQGLVALAGTLVGGALGFILAKKIAAPRSAKVDRITARKPLSAVEDLGDDGLDEDLPAPALSGRRRVLAIEEEEGPSDFLNLAPLPSAHETADEPLYVDADMIENAAFEDIQPEHARFEEPPKEFERAEDEADEHVEPFELDESAALIEDEAANEKVAITASAPRQEFIAPTKSQPPTFEVGYREPEEARATAKEPLPFSPPSMAREETGETENLQHAESEFAAAPNFAPEDETGSESEDTVSEKPIFEAPEAEATETGEFEDMTFETSADDAVIAGEEAPEAGEGEEDGEGLVQLVQRLGSTLDKHREWAAEMAARKAVATPELEQDGEAGDEIAAGRGEETVSEAPVPDEFDPAAAEDVSLAMAAYFGSSSAKNKTDAAKAEAEIADTVAAADFAKPAGAEEPRQRYESFRGTIAAVDQDDEDGEDDEAMADLAASLSLPRTSTAEAPVPRPNFDQPPPSAEVEAAEEEDEQAAEDEQTGEVEFGSANPFKRSAEEFVRIEEPEPEEGDAQPAVLFPNQEARRPAGPAGAAARAFDPPAGEISAAAQRAERPRPSNDDNERALREALMNLQRMGK